MAARADFPTRTTLRELTPQARLLPYELGEPTLTALYDSGPLTGPHGMRVQANMVTTLDGAVTGAHGSSREISSPADMRVFSVLRALADAVVVGAGTARAEGYTRLAAKRAHLAQRRRRGQADVPALVLITASGNIDTDRLDAAGNSAVIVHTSCADEATLDRLRGYFGDGNVVTHADDVTPAAVLADLRARGMRRVLCEGGPALLGTWLQAGVIDELCLTVSPLITGTGPGLVSGPTFDPPLRARPLSQLTDGSTTIHRLQLDSP